MLGDVFRVWLQATGLDRLPVEPDRAPTISIYDINGFSEAGKMVVFDRTNRNGLFYRDVSLESATTTYYTAVMYYLVSGVMAVRQFHWTIWPGGNVKGTGVACIHYVSGVVPHIVSHQTTGEIIMLKKPVLE